MSDTWSSIQAHKKQLDSLRERLQRRRKQDPLGAADPRHDLSLATPPRTSSPAPSGPDGGVSSLGSAPGSAPSPPVGGAEGAGGRYPGGEPDLAALPTAPLPPLHLSGTGGGDAQVTLRAVESLLHKFAAQELIELRRGLLHDGPALVTCADHSKLAAMAPAGAPGGGAGEGKEAKRCRRAASDVDLEIESLLSQQSTKEQQSKKVSQEILELLNTTTAKEQSIVEKFRSRGRAQVQEFCDHGTKEECVKASGGDRPCRRIINKHTDESLGDCSFLNTCFHMDTCKYVHYEIDACFFAVFSRFSQLFSIFTVFSCFRPVFFQWICCDIRYLDVSILGKFAVVMADPPWDIHMELPYGTLTDDEMRRLNIPVLQDEGFLFLWVTGRAMELVWRFPLKKPPKTPQKTPKKPQKSQKSQKTQKRGKRPQNAQVMRVDEIIWVKTNQLQRIIRTGRTGHWLNHGKEHCLVGVKGNPQGFNRGLDCDVIVAEVRSTSHKPDEIYGMIERLSITLGNQLDGIHLLDPDVVAQFKQHYPDGVISKPKPL
uniref:mRNA m(6)A methyltransferase n=1 Tax=Geospiza parvula TaxID=87175 RepID=A0A8C3NAT2_GEOPR